ncbi:DUF721 domain-containing protein [Otariodibacter sp.]|uniref:DUF721 domain-containing protein n=1 Tax=Otariodibacter sp. TaxID=3030919 RepID=UPI00260DCF69|nr:DUF721 domain-containing protein [Otariodibacter sp.]
MKIQSVKNIIDILENSSLSKIVQKSNQINTLNEHLKYQLPEQYKPLFRVTNIHHKSVTIDVKNASVHQGFLLQRAFLLKLIQTEFPHITQLELRVNPDFKSI